MIAATGSARLVVINSSRASGRHQVRRTKTQSSSQRSLSSLGPTSKSELRSSRLGSSSSVVEQRALASTYAATSRRSAVVTSSKELAQDLSFLSSTLQNGGGANHAGASASETSSGGWTRGELFASGLLALAATGSFLMASSVAASPSTAMQTAAQTTVSRFPFSKNSGGGGGGSSGGGGDPSALKPFFSARKRTEELITESEIAGEFVGKPYDVSVKALKGSRLTMEDEFFVANGGRFAAVFDGHGGGGVSATLRERLFGLVCHHLKRKKWEEQDDMSKKRASISCHVAALRSAFEDIDDQVLEDDSLQYQGSTAVAVVVHEGEDGVRTLLSANVGDSRAILSRGGRAVDLTRDHKPNDEREKARIMSMGETIEWDQYCKVHRVRNLSLSRAIGDRFAKPVVSGQVEIKHYPVLEGDEFVLLASDGLWDVMTSQDVVSYVNERLDQPPPGGLMGPEDAERLKFTRRKNMSRYVATEAIKRGTADNVCVLIVWLNDNTDKTV